MMSCEVSFFKPFLKENEDIARLLSSPNFYDENTHQLNFATFNLRQFADGTKESYVSLSRTDYVDAKHLDKKGKYIFKRSAGHYIGYALFKPIHLGKLLKDRIKLFPVRDGKADHCGMFFLDAERKMLSGDLTGTPFALKTIRSLCDLLQDKVVLK